MHNRCGSVIGALQKVESLFQYRKCTGDVGMLLRSMRRVIDGVGRSLV